MNILHIDSSITGEHSTSRRISMEIVERHRVLHPEAKVTYHDFGVVGPDHLSGALLAATRADGNHDDATARELAEANTLIDELVNADVIVIGAPMYNFTISSQLKAWIDRIIKAGKTFKYGPNGPEGLLPAGKKVFVATARGGSSDAAKPLGDHHEGYLQYILNFVGLTDVTFVRAEGLALGPDARAAAITHAQAEIARIAA